MAVRSCISRPNAGHLTSLATSGLAALSMATAIATALQLPASAAEAWSGGNPRSVLVQRKGQSGGPNTMRVISDRALGEPAEGLAAPPQSGQFEGSVPDEGVVVSSPELSDAGLAPGDGSYDVPQPHRLGDDAWQGQPDTRVGGVPFDAASEDVFPPALPGPGSCGVPGCPGNCAACQVRNQGDPAWRFNSSCEPPGLFQKLFSLCGTIDDAGLWTGRADALILYRNAPAFRPLYVTNPGGMNALNANQLNSLAAVGPRVSLFRKDAQHCGTAWEGTYIYSGSFVSERSLPFESGGYNLAPPGIYGVTNPNPPDPLDPDSRGGIDLAKARLVSSLQSAELNRRWTLGSCTQLIAGFRWIQWQENLAISDAYGLGNANAGADFYNTNCVNDLYGGQIGLDSLLWQPAKRFRLEGLIKAGAYYNNAVQTSSLSQPANAYNAMVSVGQSPASCAFAGELGLTGVVPICCNWDFRFGYFGLWLTSIAQPVNQLSGQKLDAGDVATIGRPVGSLNTAGSVVLQGLSLGLEGRW